MSTATNDVSRIEPAEENARWLIGWLEDTEALQALSGGRYGTGPFPVELLQQVQAARAAITTRPVFEPQTAVAPRAGNDPIMEALSLRPDIQAAFSGAAWRPERVHLDRLIALQKMVVTDGLDSRVVAATRSDAELRELCLPENGQPVSLDVSSDASKGAVTISSLSPNLRIQALQVGQGPAGPLVSFHIGIGTPYVTVVHLGDRFFLRDGYHRAVGLLMHGVRAVPAIIVTARTFADVASVPGMFGPEVILGDRPPTVADFLNDGPSAAAIRRPLRKLLRVAADEFYIPR